MMGIYDELGHNIGNQYSYFARKMCIRDSHIENSSKEGELILDCFAGSGTTLVGAINKNRRYIGFEIDKNYYEIAKKRIEEAVLKRRGNKTEKDTI